MRLVVTLFLLLQACTTFPALDHTVPPDGTAGAFPALVPLAPLVAQANTSTNVAQNVEAALTPRLSNLRARAARLRGPVIAAPVRARMLRGVR